MPISPPNRHFSPGFPSGSRATGSLAQLQFGQQEAATDQLEITQKAGAPNLQYSKKDYNWKERSQAGLLGMKTRFKEQWKRSLAINIGLTTLFSLVPPHIHGPLFFFPLFLAIDMLVLGGWGFFHGLDHPEDYFSPKNLKSAPPPTT